MSKTDVFENELLDLIFLNEAIANVGDAGGLQPSSTAGSLYVSLHTSDPGDSGDQTTNEIGYTNYARVAVARTSAKWSVTSDTASNVDPVTWPQCGATGATVTHFGIGTASSGAGVLLYHGALTASLAVSNGVTPEAAAGALDITEA